MADNVERNMLLHDNHLSFRGTRAMLNWFKCCQLLSKSPYLCTPTLRLSITPAPLISFIQPSVTSRWALLSTCWSGEAHLWAYLAPPESSKHSFLWLSVWWRWAAMWNAAQHQRRSQQWKYSWLQGCKSHFLPLLSQRTMALLLNLPHIDLGVVFCAICHFFLRHVYTCCAHVEKHMTAHTVFLLLLLLKMNIYK